MEQQNPWQQFQQTGSVQAYLEILSVETQSFPGSGICAETGGIPCKSIPMAW